MRLTESVGPAGALEQAMLPAPALAHHGPIVELGIQQLVTVWWLLQYRVVPLLHPL